MNDIVDFTPSLLRRKGGKVGKSDLPKGEKGMQE
jgi:hypothetical protein